MANPLYAILSITRELALGLPRPFRLMLVDCPDCARSYHLSADDVGAHGRVVICPRCNARWFLRGRDPTGDAKNGAWAVATRRDPEQDVPMIQGRTAFRLPRSVLMVSVLAILAVTGVTARETIVRTIPRLAGFYASAGWAVNLRGLQFANVASRQPDAQGTTISGEIRNVEQRRVRIPRVAFEARDAEGMALLSWSETAPAATLSAGRTLAFTSTPHRLPSASRTVQVTFVDEDAPSAMVAH